MSFPRSIPCLLAICIAASASVRGGGITGNTSTGFVPLTELGVDGYLGFPGGLYPGGQNVVPAAHLADGLERASLIRPLAADGSPDPAGKIGILAIGMSNAALVFGRTRDLMDGLWKPGVVWVNGAQGSVDASRWADPNHVAWAVAEERLASAGLSPAQVQVVVNYHAVAHSQLPPQPWPGTPDDLRQFHETIAAHLLDKFPNTRLSFWGTREYGGYSTSVNNPEPYAYRSGFAVKWMVERQIQGEPALNFHPDRGPVRVPWMDWGPYPWADGLTPRGDGLFWEARDFQPDGTHPTRRGTLKLAGPWVTLMRTSPLTSPWAVPAGNLAPICDVASPSDGALLTMTGVVALEAFAQDDDGEVTEVEFFVAGASLGVDDKPPFSISWLPPGTGDYAVHVVARDNSGATRTSQTITVRIRPPASGTTLLASDGFESGDFLGGAGWNSDSWMTGGSPSVVETTASEGRWSARLVPGATIARSLNLATTGETRLEFDWTATLPSGSSLIVEIRDTEWRTVFTCTAVSSSSWQAESVSLAAWQPSPTFGVRVRIAGTTGSAGMDRIRITREAAAVTPPPPQGQIQSAGSGHLLLTWPGAAFRTYQIETSTHLSDWEILHTTTMEENSTIALPLMRDGDTRFFRVADISPR